MMNVGRRSSQLWFCRAFVRKIEGRIPTRYWQQVKNGDHVYYVDTDTYKKTTEQPEEFVPFEAMESRLVRGLKMDQWGDPLKPVPKWQNYAGYALFTSCMLYLAYTIGYSRYKKSIETKEAEKQRIDRLKKTRALEMSRSQQMNHE
uniref:Uncharacterized protein n=1 Tax=Vannella robusta TaxID=1487602 RepID=A0A7S4MRM5_9EUKA